MIKIMRYPLHLAVIIIGAAAVVAVLWKVDPSGRHFVAYTGGLLAMSAAVDLARRLGLEPENDPARPRKRN